MSSFPSLQEFQEWPDKDVFDLVYPKKLNMAMLLNGTRRWYMYLHYNTPPEKNDYFVAVNKMVFNNIAQLLKLLANHGVYRVFIPGYSEAQKKRHPAAHEFLIKGLESLHTNHKMLEAYQDADYQVMFTGDLSFLPQEFSSAMQSFSKQTQQKNAKHRVYYDMNAINTHDCVLKMACEYMNATGSVPTREDMIEKYYGDRTIGDLNIFITANRFYARSIPPLLSGHSDRIYATVTTPVTLSKIGLRKILHDYVYNVPPIGVNYKQINPIDFKRINLLYNSNKDTIMGLTRRFDDLVFPYNELVWPENMENP